ncbi:MAG: hypothetical protein KJN61_00775 [Gammaproteobacteria bacterium]|nr:hypothetical protein [Gammaproteobacteria bacterium]MBT8074975.1 hypothetical protein [Gammaproteobacteria bacterium]
MSAVLRIVLLSITGRVLAAAETFDDESWELAVGRTWMSWKKQAQNQNKENIRLGRNRR